MFYCRINELDGFGCLSNQCNECKIKEKEMEENNKKKENENRRIIIDSRCEQKLLAVYFFLQSREIRQEF